MRRIYSTTSAPMKSCIANFKCHQILLATFSTYLFFSTAALAVVDPTDILIASDGAANDQLGWSVAISGNTAIVGAPLDDDISGNSGSAYIFLNDGAGNWTQQQKLTASFIAPDDTNQHPDADALPDLVSDKQRDAQFGYSVAIDRNVAVIGTPFYDIDSGDPLVIDTLDAGALYVFERVGVTWSVVSKFVLAEPANGDWLGSAVSVEGNTIVAGALSQSPSGKAYIFFKDVDGAWKQQNATTENADTNVVNQIPLLPNNPAIEDWFGQSVAVHGNTIVVGSDGSDNPETGSGSAYVFTRDVNHNWNIQAKLVPTDAKALANFGISVDIYNNDIIVGADAADATAIDDANGAAYVFNRNFEGGWTQVDKLIASDGSSHDKFGRSVSISGPLAVTGAWNQAANGKQGGSAYLYQKSTDGAWSEVDVIRDSAGSEFDALGFSVAVSSIDGLSDYWVVSGTPQILANGNGELQATGNIANLIDTDSDATTNDTDADHDNDSIRNVNDRFPYDPATFSDLDSDGYSDGVDQFPNNPTESADTDGDGLGNNFDLDDDGDGLSDLDEIKLGLDALNSLIPENVLLYIDTDNDGAVDANDAFPNDPTETLDTDNDGLGNNTDSDDDGDGTPDTEDSTPTGAVTNNNNDGGGGSSAPVFILMLLLANILRRRV